MTSPQGNHYDAVIVGARCAGAATAMLLARAGLRVLAIDRSSYGLDALSTHALMRGAVLQLHRWGLLDALQGAGTPAIRSTSFHYTDETIAVAIKERDGVDALYAPRRTVLDPILVDAARAAGAEVRYGVKLQGLLRAADGRVRGVRVEGKDGASEAIDAGIVIGADGLHSTVARLVDARPYHRGKHTGGVVYGYWSGLELDGFHWYFAPGAGAGAIPTNDGQTCVFIGTPARRFHDELRRHVTAAFSRILAEVAPALARLLACGELIGAHRFFPGHPGFLRQSAGPGWALVGDAGYFKDPITAHGITDALRDAELLARAVLRGSDEALADYQSTRDRLSLGLLEITDQVASYDWDAPTVKQLHRTMSKEMNREVAALVELHQTQLAA